MLKKFCMISLLVSIALAETEALDQFKKQAVQSASEAAGAGLDLMAADYLAGKLKYLGVDAQGKPVLPIWYPEYYPTTEQMMPFSSVKPQLKIFHGAAANSTYLVPQYEITQAKVGENCVPLRPAKLSPPAAVPTECLDGVKNYALDSSRLGSLEVAPRENSEQAAFVGVVDMSNMSESQKAQYFSEGTVQPSIENFAPVKVVFKKYVSDYPQNPSKLKALVVQVGSTLVQIPTDSGGNFPPQPNCQIQVVSAQPVQPGATVQFRLLANSITRGGAVSLDNGKESFLESSNLINTPVSEIGNFVRVNQNTLDLTISDADLQDSGIRRSVDLTRPNEQVWTITGRVSGVNSSLSSMFCTTSLRVNYPLLPSCNLTFDKIELLKNEKTTARLNCSGGGPVSSAIIKTYRGNQLLAAELKSERNLTTSLGSTDLSGETSKMFSFEHTRTEVVLGETVVVEVKGPGGMRPFSAALGNVCPYNETSFSRVEIPSKTVFRWYSFDPENYVNKRGDWICRNCVGGSITLNNIAFSQGSYQYTLSGQIATNETPPRTKPDNLYMWARSASDYDWIDNNWTEDKNTCILADGSWGGCWMGGAGAETCNPDNFCLMSVEYSGSGYPDKSFKVGGQFFWIEVGRADGSDGGKYDPNCRLKVVKTREGGCFAPNTRLQMADGQEKLVSEVTADDYVFNPHYQTGVRVRKVVKGPEKQSLYEVQLGKNSIQVTEDHPFLTQRGWVQALALKKGDQLMGEGPGKRVTRVEKLKYLGPQDVWNFELDTEDPLAHVVVANGIPTGDLVTQQELKKGKKPLP